MRRDLAWALMGTHYRKLDFSGYLLLGRYSMSPNVPLELI